MTMSDRVLFLLIGCVIGFVAGYIVRSYTCKNNENGIAGGEHDRRDKLRLNIALAVVVLLTAWSAFQSQRASNRVKDNQAQIRHSDYVACQNANDSRQANRELWDFIFSVSLANPGNSTKQEINYLKEIKIWIDKVYAPHDCTDLAKKYVIPEPPKVLTVPVPKPSPTK